MAEVEGIENRWILFDTVPTIVDAKYEDMRSYSQTFITQANAVIEDLRQVGRTLNPIDTSTAITELEAPDSGTFSETVPDSPDTTISLPDAPSDTDTLQDAVKTKLINDINTTSAAIPDSVETAIFNRESERVALLHQDHLDEISAEWSKRGFTLPNAILGQLIYQAGTDYFNKRQDVSRDIAIKNFELSDTNMKFAVQQGIAYNAYKVQVYTAQVNAEIARIEAIIKKYLGDLDRYKVSGQVFASLAEVNVREFEAALKQEITKAELIIKNVEIDVENFKAENTLKIEADRGISAVLSQIAAGLLSGFSATVYMSAQNSSQYSFSSNPSY